MTLHFSRRRMCAQKFEWQLETTAVIETYFEHARALSQLYFRGHYILHLLYREIGGR
jgi:hypothetical protein